MLKFKFALYAFFMILAIGLPFVVLWLMIIGVDIIGKYEFLKQFYETTCLSITAIFIACSYHLFRRPFKIAIKRIGKFFKFTWIIFLLIGIYLYSLVANSDLDTIWKNFIDAVYDSVWLTLIAWYFFIPILYTKKVAEYYSATFPDKFLRFLFFLGLAVFFIALVDKPEHTGFLTRAIYIALCTIPFATPVFIMALLSHTLTKPKEKIGEE